MSYIKNTAGQKISFLAINTGTGLPVTGDAVNITAQISIDFGAAAALSDTNPTELDATNFPGQYVFDLTQAETNGDTISISATSTTSGVQLDSVNIYTVDPAEYKADVSGLATSSALATVDGNVDAILVDTATTIPAQISGLNNFDPATDTVANVTTVQTTVSNTDMRGTDGASTAIALGIVDGKASSILTNTNTIDSKIDIIDTNIDNLDSAADIADAVWDEAYASHVVAGTFGKLMDQLRKANQAIDGSIDGASTTTSLDTDVTGYTDEAFDGELVLFVSGVLSGESRPVLSYNGTTGVMTFEEPWTQAPTISDEFAILPAHIHPTSEIANAVFTKFTDGTNPDLFKADVSNLATASSLAGVEIKVDGIKAKTDQMTFSVANQIDANSLTGGTSPSDIYTYFTDGSREDVFKADVSGVSGGDITFVDGPIKFEVIEDEVLDFEIKE